jgi:hypothetical protein
MPNPKQEMECPHEIEPGPTTITTGRGSFSACLKMDEATPDVIAREPGTENERKGVNVGATSEQ